MNQHRHKRETMSIEEATISNMWKIAAIVEALEQKAAEACGNHHTWIEEGKCNRWALQNPDYAECANVCLRVHHGVTSRKV